MDTYFEKLDQYLFDYIIERARSFNLSLTVYDLLEDEDSKRELKNVKYLLNEGYREDALCLAAKYGFADIVLENIDKLFMETLDLQTKLVNIDIDKYEDLKRLRDGGVRPCFLIGVIGDWWARLKLDRPLTRIMNISARYDRLNIMIELTNKGILISYDTLTDALRGGALKVVKYIIERFTKGGHKLKYPLSCPGETNLECLKYVLSKHKVDLSSTTREAITHGNLENLMYLNENYGINSELLYCSVEYDLKVFKYLLSQREDVEYSELVIDAISAGNVQITDYLLDNFEVEDDARKYIMDNNLCTPKTVSLIIDRKWLEFDFWELAADCVRRGRLSILKVLMDGRMKFEKRTVEEWLRVAVEEGEINTVEYLLDKGYGDLGTLFFKAVGSDNLEMVKYLVGRMNNAKRMVLIELNRSLLSKRIKEYLKSLAH